VAITALRPAPPARGQLKLSVLPPDKSDVTGTLALAPDGRTLAFVALDSESTAHLWLRRLDDTTPHMLAGTEHAAYPFWSPDGRSLGFFAESGLKRIDLAGGAPRTLAPAADPRGGTWNTAGVIVFAPNPGDGLFKVPAQGGTVERVTTLDTRRQEISHRWPTFLPDGTHVLFMNRTPQQLDERLALSVVAIEGPEAGKPRTLTASDSPGAYVDGRLYFARGLTLFSQPFDVRRLELTGEMTPTIEHVWSDVNMDGLYAVSMVSGVSAYRDSETADSQFAWFDRTGKMLGPVGPAGAADPELSPDGRFLSYDMSDRTSPGATSTGLWMLDLERGARTRLSGSSRVDTIATWSPDGRRIIFSSDRAGSVDLYERSLGQTTERELLKSNLWKYPESWSPDGRHLLFTQLDPQSRTDLWILPLDGSKPTPFVKTNADEIVGRFSPDGRWVAYASNDSGRLEVYVRTFPLSDARWQVSVNGGSNPMWRADGRELFYLALDNRMMSATVTTKGAAFEAAVPVELFKVRVARSSAAVVGGDRFYAVTGRGDRFIVNQWKSDVRASAITVVVNR
jgi:Tol biopolymer transport system component